MSLVLLSRRRLLSNIASYRWIHVNTSLPTPPDFNVLEKPEDTEKARSWIAKFKDASIPRSYVELQFARSSGPGGQVSPAPNLTSHSYPDLAIQNVNKVNTKAVVKCPLNSSWIPAWARPQLLRSVSAYSVHLYRHQRKPNYSHFT